MEWKKIKLGDLCKIVGGGTPSRSEYTYWNGGDIKWISAKHISQNHEVTGYEMITSKAVENSTTNVLPKGTLILVARVSIGKMVISRDSYAINQDLVGLIPKDNQTLDTKYLFYFLKGITNVIASSGRGASIKGVTRDYLNDIELSIPFRNGNPDIEEQGRIAERLEKIFSNIEQGEKLLVKQNLQTTNLKYSLLSNAFTKPEWKSEKLSDIANIFDDGDWIESKDQSPNGVWLVQTGNIGIITFRDKERKRFVSEDTFKRLNCTEIFTGDILISRLPDPIGRACIVPKSSYRMITAVDCTILRLKQGYEPRYINYLLNAEQTRQQVYGMITGSSRKRISRKNLGTVELPIPSKNGKPDFDEQKRIADELERGFEMSERLSNHFSNQEKSFIALRSSVLNQTFQMQT